MALFRLGDIVKIQIGLIMERKKADIDSLYAYKRLTLRSLENDKINLEAITPFYSIEPLHSEYLTKAGSVVMKLYSPLNPVVITKETEGYLIPSQIVSIQPVKPVMPEYLCLYLSQDFVAERLLANYAGIAQRAITVEALSNFEIRIPSLKNQQIICGYYQNYRRLCDLRKELEKEEKSMMKYIFSELSK
jgi:restriction endonuclease S subunit